MRNIIVVCIASSDMKESPWPLGVLTPNEYALYQTVQTHVVSRHFIVFDTMSQISVNLSFWASGLASADIFLALIGIVDGNSNLLVVGAVTFNLSFPCQVYCHC